MTRRHTTAPLATQPRYSIAQVRAGSQEARSNGDSAAAVTALVKPASIWPMYCPTWVGCWKPQDYGHLSYPWKSRRLRLGLTAALPCALSSVGSIHLPLRPELGGYCSARHVRSAAKSLDRRPHEAGVSELWHHQGT